MVGLPRRHEPVDPSGHVILRCLSLIADAPVELSEPRSADVVLVYPYAFPFTSTLSGSVLESLMKLGRGEPSEAASAEVLRRLFRVPKSARIVAISHENLDRRPWQAFGNILRRSGVPRLTFWPTDVDPVGFRFPYWWNYVRWPELPGRGSGAATRFGAYYELDELCEPMALGPEFLSRQDRAVWVTSHLEFPRRGVLEALMNEVPVDVVQGVPWGRKRDILRQYRYCVVTENSPGYGYETEKTPEAIASGCVPVGYVPNSFSDFTPEALFLRPPRGLPEVLPPLLRSRPRLEPLLEYLAQTVV